MLSEPLLCDGCGQAASPEHTALRLRRLEWATRYRPVHIATLLLGAISPSSDDDFLYSGKFQGEARALLDAAGVAASGKAAEAVLSEFQRGGFFVTHLLECPIEPVKGADSSAAGLFSRPVQAVAARIRRSLKPKRIVLFSVPLAPMLSNLLKEDVGCPVILDDGKPFELNASDAQNRLRNVLAGMAAAR